MKTYTIYKEQIVKPVEFQAFLEKLEGGVLVQAGRGEDKEPGVTARPRMNLVAAFNISDADELLPMDDNVSGGDRMGWGTACNFSGGPNGWFMTFTFFRDAEARTFHERFLQG